MSTLRFLISPHLNPTQSECSLTTLQKHFWGELCCALRTVSALPAVVALPHPCFSPSHSLLCADTYILISPLGFLRITSVLQYLKIIHSFFLNPQICSPPASPSLFAYWHGLQLSFPKPTQVFLILVMAVPSLREKTLSKKSPGANGWFHS